MIDPVTLLPSAAVLTFIGFDLVLRPRLAPLAAAVRRRARVEARLAVRAVSRKRGELALLALAAVPGLMVATLPLYIHPDVPAKADALAAYAAFYQGPICLPHVTHGARVHCVPYAAPRR